MTEKYKILAQFSKDISCETPNLETFLQTKENISKYQLNLDINSRPLKNEIIEDWWVQFQFDLSMTKGMLSEMQRHQLKINKWFDNKSEELAGVIDDLVKTPTKDKEKGEG